MSTTAKPRKPTKRQAALEAVARLRAGGMVAEAEALERLLPKPKPKAKATARPESALQGVAAEYETARRAMFRDALQEGPELENLMDRLRTAVERGLAMLSDIGARALQAREEVQTQGETDEG